ncbi:MAG: ribosome maturation factor RimP [Cyanobacteria bacterium P01_F01_bin.42]
MPCPIHSFVESGFKPTFLLQEIFADMAHPVIDRLLPLARPVAQSMGLEILDAVFQTNQSPPVLRLDIRSSEHDTGLEDCETLSREIETLLEQQDLFPDAYVLEISTPGLSEYLTEDRDFVTFRGFPVLVTTSQLYKGQLEWSGQLVERTEEDLRISLKGRIVSIPISVIEQVKLHTET